MKTPLMEKRRPGSVLYGLLCLAACCLWLQSAIYIWRMTRYYTYPEIPWLQRILQHRLSFTPSAKMYILCSPVPVVAFLFLQMKRKGWGYRITAWCLAALTAFFGIFATELVYGYAPLSRLLRELLGSSARQTALIQLLASVYVYIFVVGLGLILLGALYRSFLWVKTAVPARWMTLGKTLLACLGISVLMPTAALLLLTVAERYVPGVSRSVYQFCTSNAQQRSLFVVSILYAPLLEEIAFRGVMLPLSRKALPGWLALVFTSVCFGLWHRNLSQFLYTTIMGMIFGSMALATGGILAPMLVHFLNNLLSAMAHSTSPSHVLGAQPFWVSIGNGLKALTFWPALTALLLSIGLMIFLLVYLHRINRKQSEAAA